MDTSTTEVVLLETMGMTTSEAIEFNQAWRTEG